MWRAAPHWCVLYCRSTYGNRFGEMSVYLAAAAAAMARGFAFGDPTQQVRVKLVSADSRTELSFLTWRITGACVQRHLPHYCYPAPFSLIIVDYIPKSVAFLS